MTAKPKIIRPRIGWQEWCAFPDLGLPAIKSKTDTGAKTSALHADNIEAFEKDGEKYVRFDVHPIQKNRILTVTCETPIVDYRIITSSNGEREKRYVIRTEFKFGEQNFQSELTLTSRYGMTFRMLLGKEALKNGKFLVDPTKNYIYGKIKDAKDLYS